MVIPGMVCVPPGMAQLILLDTDYHSIHRMGCSICFFFGTALHSLRVSGVLDLLHCWPKITLFVKSLQVKMDVFYIYVIHFFYIFFLLFNTKFLSSSIRTIILNICMFLFLIHVCMHKLPC